MGDVVDIDIANITGEGLEELQAAVAAAPSVPSPVVLRTLPVPPRLLSQLREINRQVASLQARQTALAEGYAAGLSIDPSREHVTLDIETGISTITEVEIVTGIGSEV